MRLAAFVPSTILLAACLFVLTACSGGQAAKTYSYEPLPTPGGRLCTNQCKEASDYCHQNCSLDQRTCVGRIQAQALQDYDKYTRDQFATHQAIELRPSDFERNEGCNAANNRCLDDCEGHYQLCYKSCGGTVNTTTSCQAFCF